MEKLEDGYYWAKYNNNDAEIVRVSGDNVYDFDYALVLMPIKYYDFGPNPEPIKLPDWYFMPKSRKKGA